MRRAGKIIIITIVFLWIFLPGIGVHAQPDDIILNHESTFVKKRRSAVPFPHGLHMENYACLDCHHKFKDGENILDEDELEDGNPAAQCVTCHDLNSNCNLHKAFHIQCLDCHVEESGKGINSGPRQCRGCHSLKK